MTDPIAELLMLLPVTATDAYTLSAQHLETAIHALQYEVDINPDDLIILAFDTLVLDVFYMYAKQECWGQASITAAENKLFTLRREKCLEFAHLAYDLACGRDHYSQSEATNKLIRQLDRYVGEILVDCIIAGKAAAPPQLPPPNLS